MSSSARSGSHLRIITSFKPAAAHESITATDPVTWNSGTMRMNTGGWASATLASSGCRTRATVVRQAKAMSACRMARCVDTAPFGLPVVPDV